MNSMDEVIQVLSKLDQEIEGILFKNGGNEDFSVFLENTKDILGVKEIQEYNFKSPSSPKLHAGVYFALGNADVVLENAEKYTAKNQLDLIDKKVEKLEDSKEVSRARKIKIPKKNDSQKSTLTKRIREQSKVMVGDYEDKRIFYIGKHNDSISERIEKHFNTDRENFSDYAMRLVEMTKEDFYKSVVILGIGHSKPLSGGEKWAWETVIQRIESHAHDLFKPLVGRK